MKKEEMKKLTDTELLKLQDEKYKEYKKNFKNSFIIMIFAFIGLMMPFTIIFKIFLSSTLLTMVSLKIIKGTMNFFKYMSIYFELMKRGYSEEQIFEKTNKLKQNCSSNNIINNEENMEPCPSFEEVFPEFANNCYNYNGKDNTKENTFKR